MSIPYTTAKLKLSSSDKALSMLLPCTPSPLISSVDITLTPNPIQVFDKKQASIFSPLHHAIMHYNIMQLCICTYVFNCSYRSEIKKYGISVINHKRNPYKSPRMALEKNTL